MRCRHDGPEPLRRRQLLHRIAAFPRAARALNASCDMTARGRKRIEGNWKGSRHERKRIRSWSRESPERGSPDSLSAEDPNPHVLREQPGSGSPLGRNLSRKKAAAGPPGL
ncbi:hypothetical protein FQA47_012278 [Oryzias melastigma]|uniref:Uncharacterized protein n=1 Tax=Oryzias melastigma TaxID=30732 RepID=A0A834CF26_ORYME|nr:hypothetical protein FQA47_012278 [Oryzias melastigma]